MPTTAGRRRRAPAALALMLVSVLAALVGAVLAAGPAWAHAELESTDPKDGASLTKAPDEVRMRFGEDLLPEAVRVVASDADGTQVPLPDPVVDANEATVAWPSEAPAGSYTVSFRVVSQDGHPITGSFTFSYERSAGGPTEQPSPSGGTQASASASTPASSPSVEATPSTSPVAADQAAGASPGLVVGLAVVALAVLVGVVLWMTRRGRTDSGAGAGG